MEGREASPLIVLVDMDNTISHFNERAIERYEEVYKPKKPRKLDTLRYCNAEDNYPLKQRELVHALCEEPGFMLSVKPVDGAIRALKEMRAMGLDVRICCPPSPSPGERIKWMENHFHTPDWQERIIFTLDKTIIKGDYLIDDDPTPITRTSCNLGKPDWEHVIFDKPYNRHVADKKRIKTWLNWKVEIGLDELELMADKIKGDAADIQSFHHGSEDSTDQDKYYVFPYVPSARESQDFCSGTGQEDRNIITLEKGVIRWAYKGHCDECNNDLLHTYKLHAQMFPCPITRKVTRNVPRKVLGTLRKVIAMYYCDNPEAIKIIRYREWEERRKLFELVDFCQDSSFRVFPSAAPAPVTTTGGPSSQLVVQDLKTIATQLAMAVALLVGREVYTKKDIVALYPELEPFIYRRQELIYKPEQLQVLNQFKDIIHRALTHVRSKQVGFMVYYSLEKSFYQEQAARHKQQVGTRAEEPADEIPPPSFPYEHVSDSNHFIYQCKGMAAHINTEECSMFGVDSYHIPVNVPSWPYMTFIEWRKRIRAEGEEEEGTSLSATHPSPSGRWGRLLHVFSFGDQVTVSNEWDAEDEEGLALLNRSFPAFSSSLRFDRYHHIFQVFYVHATASAADDADTIPTDSRIRKDFDSTAVVLLVALRSTFSYEIIPPEETASYAATVGCPTLHTLLP